MTVPKTVLVYLASTYSPPDDLDRLGVALWLNANGVKIQGDSACRKVSMVVDMGIGFWNLLESRAEVVQLLRNYPFCYPPAPLQEGHLYEIARQRRDR